MVFMGFREMPVEQVEEFALNGGLNHMIFLFRLRFLFRLASLGSYFLISLWPLSISAF